jgi:hypothetical protein
MSSRTRLIPIAVLGVWLATPAPAGAHRLDEYLQATRLSVDIGQVGLEIDLTAGVRVASEVFGWLDADGDGRISAAEAEAYARQMLRSVDLCVDGRTVPIGLLEILVPPFHDMSLGVGAIRIRAGASVPAAGSGRHRLSFVNRHRPESSAYLVNVLVPTDPRIRIGSQTRDGAQHGLTLDYVVMPDAAWAGTCSLLALLAMAGLLGATRRSGADARSRCVGNDAGPGRCGEGSP